MYISKDITMTRSINGYYTIAPDGLNYSTVIEYEDLQTEVSRRQETLKMLETILKNTPEDFAKQVLEALKNEDLIICETDAERAASAIRDTLCAGQEKPNTLQNQATCFSGIMFGDSQAPDLMMRTMQSVLHNVVPHCNARDMIKFPDLYQSIIDNTPPDAFRYEHPQCPTSFIRCTAFEVDPQSVKARIHGALEQIKGSVSNEARQAIEETEAQLDAIIANDLQTLHAGRCFIPLRYNDLQQTSIPTLSDRTHQIVDEAAALSGAIRNGIVFNRIPHAFPVNFGAIAEVTPGGEILNVSLMMCDDKETLTYDVTECTSREFQHIFKYIQDAAKNFGGEYRRPSLRMFDATMWQKQSVIPSEFTSARELHACIKRVHDSHRDTPSVDEQDNETPGDID